LGCEGAGFGLYSCLSFYYYKEQLAMLTNLGEQRVTMEECEITRLYTTTISI